MTTLKRELLVVALFVALAIAFTWPLAIRLDTAVSDLGDPLLNVWIIDWVCHALLTNPLSLYDAPMYVPGRLPLAYSENLVGIALFALPFHAAGVPPLTVYNLMILLGFALSGYGAYVLARVVTGHTLAAIAAGIFFAFSSWKFDHLSHLQFIFSGWLPLLFAALFVYRRRPTTRNAALLGGAFLMNGLTNVHFFLFGSFALVLTLIFWAAFDERRDRRYWLRLAASIVIAGILLLPFLIPYRIVANEYRMKRGEGETLGGSATWSDWLIPGGRSLIYTPVVDDQLRQIERQLFPGLVPLFLAGCAILLTRRRTEPATTLPAREHPRLLRTLDVLIVLFAAAAYIGAVTDRFVWRIRNAVILSFDTSDVPAMLLLIAILVRLSIRFPRPLGGDEGRSLRSAFARSRFTAEEWAAAIWIAIGVLASLGLNSFFHEFLFRRVEIFQSVRAPARWVIIAQLGLAVWAAMGIAVLAKRRAVAIALVALVGADNLQRLQWEHIDAKPAPVYRWLNATRPRGPVLEMPLSGFGVQYRYLLSAATHHVPIMNGISGFEPPIHAELREKGEHDKMDAAYTALVERSGCQLLVVHADWLSRLGPRTQTWLRRELASGRLAFVRRFDHGIDGDWVFAVTRNLPDWHRYRRDAPDGAGNLPDENLTRWLSGKPTYNDSIFGRMDHPKFSAEIHGKLEVWGWAMSPHGVKRVTVLVDSGRSRYEAFLTPREDISKTWPWYSKSATPAFTAIIPKRPKGLYRWTDVQVEVEDGAGNVTRFTDVMFMWD